jgi:hypothetical protein
MPPTVPQAGPVLESSRLRSRSALDSTELSATLGLCMRVTEYFVPLSARDS